MSVKASWVVVAVAIFGATMVVHADEYNFRYQASRQGCESIITEAEAGQATSEVRDIENKLAQVNAKYGKDSECWAGKLIDQYVAEGKNHEKPLAEAKNRVDSCKQVDELDYQRSQRGPQPLRSQEP